MNSEIFKHYNNAGRRLPLRLWVLICFLCSALAIPWEQYRFPTCVPYLMVPYPWWGKTSIPGCPLVPVFKRGSSSKSQNNSNKPPLTITGTPEFHLSDFIFRKCDSHILINISFPPSHTAKTYWVVLHPGYVARSYCSPQKAHKLVRKKAHWQTLYSNNKRHSNKYQKYQSALKIQTT